MTSAERKTCESLRQAAYADPTDPLKRRILADFYEEVDYMEEAAQERHYANLHESINHLIWGRAKS